MHPLGVPQNALDVRLPLRLRQVPRQPAPGVLAWQVRQVLPVRPRIDQAIVNVRGVGDLCGQPASHHVVQPQHPAFQIELEQGKPRQALRHIFGIDFVQFPDRAAAAARGMAMSSGKIDSSAEALAVGRVQQIQTDFEDAGDGAVTRSAVGSCKCRTPLRSTIFSNRSAALLTESPCPHALAHHRRGQFQRQRPLAQTPRQLARVRLRGSGTALASIDMASASRISSTVTGLASPAAMLEFRVVNRRAEDLPPREKRAQVVCIPHVVDHQQTGPFLELLSELKRTHPHVAKPGRSPVKAA